MYKLNVTDSFSAAHRLVGYDEPVKTCMGTTIRSGLLSSAASSMRSGWRLITP